MKDHIPSEALAWLKLATKSHVHYAQDGDNNTYCGMNKRLVQSTQAKDFVTCPNCKQGTIRI